MTQDFLNSVMDPAAMSGGMWNVNRRWKLASAPFSSKFQSNIEVDEEVDKFVSDPDEEWLWHLNQLTAVSMLSLRSLNSLVTLQSPLPSLSEKENTMRAHLTVKGQGSLLFYSTMKPKKLCVKPLQATSSPACEPSTEGRKPLATVSELVGMRGDRAWEEWDFSYKDGELIVELPDMSSVRIMTGEEGWRREEEGWDEAEEAGGVGTCGGGGGNELTRLQEFGSGRWELCFLWEKS
eukprot:266365-Hanusia_phi.AAC.6